MINSNSAVFYLSSIWIELRQNSTQFNKKYVLFAYAILIFVIAVIIEVKGVAMNIYVRILFILLTSSNNQIYEFRIPNIYN